MKMTKRALKFVGLAMGALGVASAADAQTLGTNLVVNGDAELGSIDGWIDGGIEAVASTSAGTLGLPAGVSIGDFSFTGALGPAKQSLAQSIDVSLFAAQIDAGKVSAVFGVLLQARGDPNTFDTASALLEYRDGAQGVLASVNFADTTISAADWDSFEDVRTVPAGTRELWVALSATRTVGLSSDGFFDNISIVLSWECYADCDQSTGAGVLDVFDFLCFQNSFVNGETYACDCDTTTGNGVCDVFDFLCFQDAFVGGCP